MPSMADITVKNKANVDVVYVAKVPSAGDKTPARWTLDAANAVAGFRPTVTVGTRTNGNGNARIMEVNYAFPIIGTINGVDTQLAKMTGQASFTLPTNVDSTKVSDGYFQLSNLLVATLFRAMADAGYSAT